MKKHLTRQEEFEMMKLVLDKFLWLGILVLGFGLYRILISSGTSNENLSIISTGAFILILFVWIIVKEYEIVS